jgi:hypothetical protein
MATALRDGKGVPMLEFMQQGTTITSEVYCKTLKQLCRAIQNKRHGLLIFSVVPLCDNVIHIQATAEVFQLGVV